MSYEPPEGWTKESPTRFKHRSGIVVCLTEEYGEKGWYVVPNNDQKSVQWFSPTPSGRDRAFEAFLEHSRRFHRGGPRKSHDDTIEFPCRNCGAKTTFGPDDVERSVRQWCEDCFSLRS